MKKRLLAVFVVLVLALTMLSGCGSNNTGGTSNNSNATNSSNSGSSKVNIGNSTIETGASWPANWPSDIPKLDGTVKSSVSTDVHSSTGLSVFLSVSNEDVVKTYANNLIAKGYEQQTSLDDNGDYAVSLKGTAYEVSVTFSSDTKDASVTVTAVQ